MKYLERLLVGAFVVGWLASTTSQAAASFTAIDVPGAPETVPFAINGRGQIVGFYGTADSRHGLLLDVVVSSALAVVTLRFGGAAFAQSEDPLSLILAALGLIKQQTGAGQC